MSYVFERLNERRDGGRESGVDAGFTLIELMVVLLIMAILLAIAIPTFLGVSGSANDRAAQSNLNTALTNAKSYYDSNQQTYGTDNGATAVLALTTQEPSVKWQTAASTSSGIISVYTATDGNGIILAAESKTGECWYLVDNAVNEGASPGADDAVISTLANGADAPGTWYGVAKTTTCNAAVPNTGAKFQGGSTGAQGFPAAA